MAGGRRQIGYSCGGTVLDDVRCYDTVGCCDTVKCRRSVVVQAAPLLLLGLHLGANGLLDDEVAAADDGSVAVPAA